MTKFAIAIWVYPAKDSNGFGVVKMFDMIA